VRRVVRFGVVVVLRLFIIITYRCRFINIFKQNDDDEDEARLCGIEQLLRSFVQSKYFTNQALF